MSAAFLRSVRNSRYDGEAQQPSGRTSKGSRTSCDVEHGRVGIDQLAMICLHDSTPLEKIVLERANFLLRSMLQAYPCLTCIHNLNSPELFGIEYLAVTLPARVHPFESHLP